MWLIDSKCFLFVAFLLSDWLTPTLYAPTDLTLSLIWLNCFKLRNQIVRDWRILNKVIRIIRIFPSCPAPWHGPCVTWSHYCTQLNPAARLCCFKLVVFQDVFLFAHTTTKKHPPPWSEDKYAAIISICTVVPSLCFVTDNCFTVCMDKVTLTALFR